MTMITMSTQMLPPRNPPPDIGLPPFFPLGLGPMQDMAWRSRVTCDRFPIFSVGNASSWARRRKRLGRKLVKMNEAGALLVF